MLIKIRYNEDGTKESLNFMNLFPCTKRKDQIQWPYNKVAECLCVFMSVRVWVRCVWGGGGYIFHVRDILNSSPPYFFFR